MPGLPYGRGPGSGRGHPERKVLHELSFGDRQGQAGNQENGGLSSARGRHFMGARIRLQRVGSRKVQPRSAHKGRRGVLELPRRYAAANDGGARS